MIERDDWSRIASYVTGSCSDEEMRAFEMQLRSDPHLSEAVDEARRIWEGAELGVETELAEWDLAEAWDGFFRDKVTRRSLEVAPTAAPRRSLESVVRLDRKRRWMPVKAWMAAAAVLMVAIGAGLWFRSGMTGGASRPSVDAAMYTVTTAAGQRLDLRMPDGSRVVLAAASTLRYPKAYGAARRDVYLEGRAYFEVTHDETRPFTVYAGQAVARDLGTRFDVRAYKNDGRVDVAVTEGAVELAVLREHTPPNRVLLTAGQLGHADAGGAMLSQSPVDLDRYVSWIDGRLVFTNTPLHEVLPELSRWYDVSFELADQTLGARRFTGTFYAEPLAEVLQFLTLSVDAGYQRHGRAIVLTPNR